MKLILKIVELILSIVHQVSIQGRKRRTRKRVERLAKQAGEETKKRVRGMKPNEKLNLLNKYLNDK